MLHKEQIILASILAALDTSIQPMFKVEETLDDAFANLVSTVPEANRAQFTAAYMIMQNTLINNMAKDFRSLMGNIGVDNDISYEKDSLIAATYLKLAAVPKTEEELKAEIEAASAVADEATPAEI